MDKTTDKELTADIVCAYVDAWMSSGTRAPIQGKDLCAIIDAVHKTLSELEDK